MWPQLLCPPRVYSLAVLRCGNHGFPNGALEDGMMQVHESPRRAESGNETVEDSLHKGSVSTRSAR